MVFGLNLIIVAIQIGYIYNGSSPDKSTVINDYVGETMQYNLRYGIFNIGIASISCLDDKQGCGPIIKAEAQSTGILKVFKDLEYRFECCVDLVKMARLKK